MSKPTLSLRESAKQAMMWSAGINLFRDVLQFGQMLILARILDPAIYGVAGLATTLINFIGLGSFQHVIAHVLQVRADKEVNYHQHFTAGLVLNTGLFVLANAIAFGLGFTDQYAQLGPLLHLLSLTFLLSVPVDMRVKMLERDHNWTRLRSLQLAGFLVSIVGGIVMGVAGAGVYALIIPGLLASSVMMLDLFLFANWRSQWQWSLENYRETLHFGLNRASSNALNGGRGLLQNTLISHHSQFVGLGLFSRAEGLANMFCGRISQQVSFALYPVITRAPAQSVQFQRISGLVLASVAWVVTPIAVFFSMEAASLIATLYGSKWLDVAPLLPLAMVSGLAISVGATAYSLLLANDQTRACLRSDMLAFVISAGTMVALIPFGVKTYLMGAAVSNSVIALILVALLIQSRGLVVNGLINALVPPFTASALAGLCAWGGQSYLPNNSLALTSLLVSWLLFTALYLAVLRIFFQTSMAEIISYLPGRHRINRLLCL